MKLIDLKWWLGSRKIVSEISAHFNNIEFYFNPSLLRLKLFWKPGDFTKFTETSTLDWEVSTVQISFDMNGGVTHDCWLNEDLQPSYERSVSNLL